MTNRPSRGPAPPCPPPRLPSSTRGEAHLHQYTSHQSRLPPLSPLIPLPHLSPLTPLSHLSHPSHLSPLSRTSHTPLCVFNILSVSFSVLCVCVCLQSVEPAPPGVPSEPDPQHAVCGHQLHPPCTSPHPGLPSILPRPKPAHR